MRFYQNRNDDPLVISTILQPFLGLVLLTVGLAAPATSAGVIHGREAPAISAGLLLMWSFSWFELTAKLQIGNFNPLRYLRMNLGRALFIMAAASAAAWFTHDQVWTAIGMAVGTVVASASLGGLNGWRVGRRYFDFRWPVRYWYLACR